MPPFSSSRVMVALLRFRRFAVAASAGGRFKIPIRIDGNKKLTAADRAKIFEGNARRVFKRFPATL